MMNFWLLQAIGDIDPDLVERAAQRPRKVLPLRWVAAVAAAAVMVVGVGAWWLNRPEGKPPITPPADSTTTTATNGPITATTVGGVITPTTTTTTITTTVTTTEPTTQPTTVPDDPPATGGDDKSCVVHSLLYHSIPVDPDAVGEELYDAYLQAYSYSYKGEPLPDPDLTYPFTECNYPESNIVNFVKFTGITQEEFIASAWNQDWMASVGGVEAFLDMPYDNGNPYALFTYGDYFDAIYGDDPHLTAWVFHHAASSVLNDPDYPYQYCYRLYSYPEDPLYNLEGYPSYKEYSSLSGNNESIIGFVNYAGITREKFIEVYGWGDKLDEKATDHFAYAPYTYRQFVDAIYGDDQALRDWVFDRYVFSPDYPKAP